MPITYTIIVGNIGQVHQGTRLSNSNNPNFALEKPMLEKLFSPCVSLIWRGYGGKLTRHYFPNRNADRPLLEQFMREAGISTNNGIKVTVEQVDAVLAAASNHGYSVETIGEPETVETPAC